MQNYTHNLHLDCHANHTHFWFVSIFNCEIVAGFFAYGMQHVLFAADSTLPTLLCTQWPGVSGNSCVFPPCPDEEGCLRFFIHSCSVWASCQCLAPAPYTTERTLFYGFSPVSCKAGGRRLLWISHALCRKLPRGRHNSVLWRPPPLLNSPTPPSTPFLCLHH